MSKFATLFLAACLCLGGPPPAQGADASLPGETQTGTLLPLNVETGATRDLVVVSGPDTVADRGRVRVLAARAAFQGSFRYWEEPGGRMLYVYDETQDLVARIIEPARVILLDLRSPE